MEEVGRTIASYTLFFYQRLSEDGLLSNACLILSNALLHTQLNTLPAGSFPVKLVFTVTPLEYDDNFLLYPSEHELFL